MCAICFLKVVTVLQLTNMWDSVPVINNSISKTVSSDLV